MSNDYVYAPFTSTEVDSLNAYQQSGVFHDFTCGNMNCPGPYRSLRARHWGWKCPSCNYKQGWAWRFMADRSWEVVTPGRLNGGLTL